MKTAGDGTNLAYFTLSVPAMPANALWQNILIRTTTGALWTVSNQITNTGTDTVRVDDLTCGETYYVATQAHPELKSRPTQPHPLFVGLVEAALSRKLSARLPVTDE